MYTGKGEEIIIRKKDAAVTEGYKRSNRVENLEC